MGCAALLLRCLVCGLLRSGARTRAAPVDKTQRRTNLGLAVARDTKVFTPLQKSKSVQFKKQVGRCYSGSTAYIHEHARVAGALVGGSRRHTYNVWHSDSSKARSIEPHGYRHTCMSGTDGDQRAKGCTRAREPAQITCDRLRVSSYRDGEPSLG